jgi:peptide/nickel transport system permease protein
MLETLRQEYVMTARAKGLKERIVINKHARRNALIPVVTIAGIMVAFLFNGLVVTEYIFDLHGLGRWVAMAAQQFDVPALLGFLLFNGFLIVLANLIVDIMYAFIDPRVKLE